MTANQVLIVPELVCEILKHCDIPTLANLSCSSFILHQSILKFVKSLIEKRMRTCLPFVPPKHIWSLLDHTHAVVGGLVAMEFSFSLSIVSRELNIIIPLGEVRPWATLLLKYGFQTRHSLPIYWEYRTTAKTIQQFVHTGEVSIQIS